MKSGLLQNSYGVGLCLLIGIVAIIISKYIPFGSVSLAIILGIIVGNLIPPNEIFKKGITFSEKHLLSFAIALMGVSLNFQILKELGFKSILLIVTGLTVTIGTSLLLAKVFKFDNKFSLLLGIGNGVCGSSAIAATEQIIGARKEDVGLSIAVINFLGTVAMFILPVIATMVLSFSDIKTGLLVGNTLQAVGQVVAAGFSVSTETGQIATLVKMTRILMLFPLIMILLVAFRASNKKENTSKRAPAIPFFIIGFILFSLLPTFNILPPAYINLISNMSHYILIAAMVGIGLKISLQSILQNGRSALFIGSLIFLIQVIFSITIIMFIFP